MPKFTAYDLETGRILYIGTARDLKAQEEAGIGIIEGCGDARTQRVVRGKLRAIPKHERERRDRARAMRKLRARRDARLREMGQKLNPIYWSGLTEDQRAAWREYRQTLLDLPQTVADLENVDWPTPPE